MVRMTAVIVAATLGLAAAAWADVKSGDACASNLSPAGKSIYAAVVAANPTIKTLRETARSQVRSMVASGKISADAAEANGILAAECVRVRLQ